MDNNKHDNNLTESQKLEAKYAFDLLDISHDSTINYNDVKTILSQMNQKNIKDEELIKIFEQELGNKFISKKQEDIRFSFDDFLSIMNKRFRDQDIATELTESFKMLGGQDNKIILKSLVDELSKYGDELPKKEIENLLYQLQESTNEYFNYDVLIQKYFSPKK